MQRRLPHIKNGTIIMLGVSLVSATLLVLLYFVNPDIFSVMSDHAVDWLAEKAIGWSHTPPVNKIDTHHHFVPSFYAQGKPTFRKKACSID